ncbi:MAG TPA: Gfo/Idh/MocA family oxidoreductase [Blastocatellia bacterium]|nr:Gfo/Idh/MocA family oxidoreductase [Blastocatellia bacterium]HMV81963.1 Gfo/Idh/MocA family oxidoreductase [Blastocatellia bacterium]HMX25802.1 Gfo/Idh/MocA family oxidoreductase [Blastocatellia bacterium]HMY70478.1 Gfo/Idh/MocA family oxidoreductase [Blastocatellia bacterium]HMZ16343.1 Gfo/Idh/MocA family oxidoreductase [Blastocatellia bacterium]
MKDEKIGIGLIGTGFARSAQAPAFQLCDGTELVAVCSGQHENALKVAAEFGIKHACESYEQLLALEEVSLVVVAAPPYLHHPITIAALNAGKHVICEKPMALNAGEARAMTELAATKPHQLSIIDHELRFNPTWRRMKELVDGGFLGDLHHVTVNIASGFRHSAQRPWNWWSQKSAGGGLLGALGSHAIDAVRWMFGDIAAVCSTVATMVPERKDAKTSEMNPNETDDYCSFLLRFAPHEKRTAHGVIQLSALYASGGKNQISAVGSNGTLVLDGEETLLGAIGYNHPFEDMSLADRAREISVLPDNVWARSFYHLARETAQALREDRTEIAHAATFNDGLHCQEVIDAVLRSHAEQRWIEIG